MQLPTAPRVEHGRLTLPPPALLDVSQIEHGTVADELGPTRRVILSVDLGRLRVVPLRRRTQRSTTLIFFLLEFELFFTLS